MSQSTDWFFFICVPELHTVHCLTNSLPKGMNKEFIKEMEDTLHKEHARITSELETISAQNPKNKEDHVATFHNFGEKEDENAAEVEEYSANLTLEHTLESTLRDIDSALSRIEKGTYGICEKCGGEIEAELLKIDPESRYCRSCK